MFELLINHPSFSSICLIKLRKIKSAISLLTFGSSAKHKAAIIVRGRVVALSFSPSRGVRIVLNKLSTSSSPHVAAQSRMASRQFSVTVNSLSFLSSGIKKEGCCKTGISFMQLARGLTQSARLSFRFRFGKRLSTKAFPAKYSWKVRWRNSKIGIDSPAWRTFPASTNMPIRRSSKRRNSSGVRPFIWWSWGYSCRIW